MSAFLSEERDGTLIVTLDRPPVNALNAETLEEGAAFFQKLAANPPEGVCFGESTISAPR